LLLEYLAPTPLDCELVLLCFLEETKGRKVVLRVELNANDQICTKGRVVAVRTIATFFRRDR
jgi:hypothetical protein